MSEDYRKEERPSEVGENPKQDGEVPIREGGDGQNLLYGPERMLTALEKGVKGGQMV
ncbi:MAG: hypothetical protein HS132_04385 [Planctomycetia bacterium]|nr:hypothetical protein [Planctomycetia bacterium]